MPTIELAPPRDWPSLGLVVIEWCEHFLCHGPGDLHGDSLWFDEELTQVTLDMYRLYPRGHAREGRRVVTEGLVSLPKGRAKSEWAGALACAELRGPVRFDGWDADGQPVGRPVKDAFVRILATEEGQTGHTFGNALVMLEHAQEVAGRRDEWGFRRLDIGQTRIIDGPLGVHGEIRPCTAGSASKDGGKETFTVCDEPHLYVTNELREMHKISRRNGRKRKAAQPWMLNTTTMFEPGKESTAETLYREAERLLERPNRSHRFCYYHREGDIDPVKEWDDEDAQLRSLEEAYGPAAEWMDLEGILEGDIRAAGTNVADALRYWHNIRWKGSGKAIDPGKWAELADPSRNAEPGARVVLWFDGSQKGQQADHTVLGLVTVDDRPHVQLLDWWGPELNPETGEWTIPRGPVKDAVTAAKLTYSVGRFGCDPHKWVETVDAWDDEFGEGSDGKPVVDSFDTSKPTRMGPAIDRLLEMLDDGAFTHDGSPELTWYALNALLTKAKGQGDYHAFAKPTAMEKIDGLVGMTIGLDIVRDVPPEKPKRRKVSVW